MSRKAQLNALAYRAKQARARQSQNIVFYKIYHAWWPRLTFIYNDCACVHMSEQRGFLELDLIVGGWAEANLPSLSAAELKDFAVVLDQENPELFKWLTGQARSIFPFALPHTRSLLCPQT